MAKAKRARSGGDTRRRAEDILARMTLEEKSAQICSIAVASVLDGRKVSREKCAAVLAGGIGQISRLGGDNDFEPHEIAAATTAIQAFLTTKTRLRIPAIVHEECLSGYMVRHATTFPEAIGLAGTWDPALIEEITGSIAKLMRAVGAHQGLAPLFDVAREPRWGALRRPSARTRTSSRR